MNDYNANSIETLDFVSAIRKRIEMYMGSADNQGVLQCIREIISNSIDEFSIGYGNKIEITVDTNNNIFTCRDYARSIPFGIRNDGTEAMIATFMTPHTGGKFSDKQYGNAVIGQNGIGIKGVALSAENFKAQSFRDGQCATLILNKGKKISYEVTPTKELNGTYIEFSPSQEVYRLEEIHMSFEEIRQMCEDWSYLNKGLSFILKDIINNKTIIYFSKKGIVDFILSKTSSSIQKEPYSYYIEDEEGNKMEIAFLWGSKNEMSYVFTNGLHNINGGTSLTGAKTGITRTINNLIKMKLNGETIRSNLCYVINAKVPHASFSDQTKMRINNGSLKPLGDKAFSEAIKEFSITHKEEFNKIIELLVKITRAEAAADRARIAVMEQSKEIIAASTKKILLPDKFKDCEQHGEQSMLGICEGDSALAGLATARNIETFALFPIKGKIISALKNPLDKVLQNQEVSGILKILGCGFQESYNSRRLRFGKVAICTDSDPDGASIGCLIATVFYVLMPQFIEEGRLYWLRAPFYRLKKNNIAVYAYNNKELAELQKKYVGYEQVHYKGLGELTAEDMRLTMCNEQNQRLERLTLHDAEKAYQQLEVLMGKFVQDRRDFLFENVNFGEEYDY